MFRLFDGTADGINKASAVAGTKLWDGLKTTVAVLTPALLVIALGLVIWALVGRMYGKTVDGERQKMAKGQFIGILVTGVVLITLASIFAVVVSKVILTDNALPKWFGFENENGMRTAATSA